jgi:GTP1/Obg family GTP-binding protein
MFDTIADRRALQSGLNVLLRASPLSRHTRGQETAMPRTARKTRNQVLFREVNARIADISSSLDDSIEALGLICECSQTGPA